MKHFQYFPTIEYSGSIATNLMVRGRVRELINKNSTAFYNYIVSNGERPDHISYAYYGSTAYTWSILYANEIFDVLYDWPLSDREFESFIISKYGSIENTQSLADESMILTLGTGSGTANIGQTLFQGTSLVNAISTGVVTDWNPTTKRLRLKNVTGDFHRLSGNIRNSTNTFSYEILRRRDIIHRYELSIGNYADTVISKEDFLDSNKFIDDGKRLVTIYEHELRLNEDKRQIKLIQPEVVFRMANELKLLFK